MNEERSAGMDKAEERQELLFPDQEVLMDRIRELEKQHEQDEMVQKMLTGSLSGLLSYLDMVKEVPTSGMFGFLLCDAYKPFLPEEVRKKILKLV